MAKITIYLKRLEAAGFVRREIDPSDLRRHRLLLTATGRKATAGGMSALSEEFTKRLGRLTAAQQTELKNLLEKII
jgi:DNA-binding MarR family transcriptional regulator